ncbi:MAG: hypothetical protein RR379_07710 [Clostridia bacterium]
MPIRFNAKKAAVSNASSLPAENSITEGVIWKQLLFFNSSTIPQMPLLLASLSAQPHLPPLAEPQEI